MDQISFKYFPLHFSLEKALQEYSNFDNFYSIFKKGGFFFTTKVD